MYGKIAFQVMRIYLLVFLILITAFRCHCQIVEGKITDQQGRPISNAALYCADSSLCNMTNSEGDYQLKLKPGKYNFTIHCYGYITKELELECLENPKHVDIVLCKREYSFHYERSNEGNQEAGYTIIQKAIAMGSYYINQLAEFDCKIYLKVNGNETSESSFIRKSRGKKTNHFVYEKIIDFHCELPETVAQNTISFLGSEEKNDRLPLDYITTPLYKEIHGAISPLNRDANTYYKFQHISSFLDRRYLVYKIKVIPYQEGCNLYSGFLYIVDGLWCLYGVELQIQQNSRTITINQIYAPVKNEVWMPISHNYSFENQKIGKKLSHTCSVAFFEYQIKVKSNLMINPDRNFNFIKKENTDLDKGIEFSEIHQFLQKNILAKSESKKLSKLIRASVEQSNNKKKLEIEQFKHTNDSAKIRTYKYWNSIRPMGLTDHEIRIHKKGLLNTRIDAEESNRLKRKTKTFRWSKVLVGGNFSFDKEKHQFLYGGIFDPIHIDYNTTEKIKYGNEFTYSYYKMNGKHFQINYDIDYSFGRQQMTHDIGVKFRYNGLKRGNLFMSGGTITSDFDSSTGIPKNLNLITTVFLNEDYLKAYQKDYIEIAHRIDLINGLDFLINLEYAKRKKIMDLAKIYIDYYTSDTSSIATIEDSPVGDHNGFNIRLRLRYTPEYYYKVEKGTKIYLHSNYPTFTLNYYKGVKNIFCSNVNFDRIETSILQNIQIRKIGLLHYELIGGNFININKVYFADYKRFGTNTPFVMGTSPGNIFRLLEYYEYSTIDKYVETHIKLTNFRILLKRLPVLNRRLMNENLYFSSLHTVDRMPYYEVGYGLNKIFNLFNLEAFVGFIGKTHKYTGVKLGVPFIERKGVTVTKNM